MADFSDYSVAKLYSAGATSPSSARRSGSTYSLAGTGAAIAAQQRRKRLLEQAVKSGKLSLADLGRNDSSLLAKPKIRDDGGGDGGILGGVGHFFGNLGSDIWQTGKYLVPGMYKVGSAAVRSIDLNPFNNTEENRKKQPFLDEIVKPALEGYKETYGHGGGHFLKSFYEHPLGPILDVATLFSGGAAGAAKVGGKVGRLAEPGSASARIAEKAVNLTSRGGRAPFVHPVTGHEIPREFTPRPVSKTFQRGLDTITRTGENENLIGKVLRQVEQRKQARRFSDISHAKQYEEAGEALEGLEPLAGLSDNEAIALTLAQSGVNTATRLDAFQRMVRENMAEDPDWLQGEVNATGMSPKYVERMASLPDAVKNLVHNPTEGMVAAHQAWKARVVQQQQELGLGPEVTQQHLATEREQLQPHIQGVDADPVDYPIEHVYVPKESASGFVPSTEVGGRLSKTINRLPGRKERFVRGPTEMRGGGAAIRGTKYTESVFTPKKPSHAYMSTGRTFASGAFRTDARLYLDHVVKRARENADEFLKRDEFQRIAAKDENGEVRRFINQDDVDRTFGRDKMVFVNDEFPQIYFRKEQDYLKQVQSAIENYLKDTPEDRGVNLLNDPQMEELIGRVTDADAQAFLQANWGTLKRKGGAVPVDEFNYRVRLAQVDQPFNNSVARFFTRWMHRWRTAVLTLMPRWAMNTALGSMIMNTIRGVDLRDYWIAQKLHKAKLLPAGANLGHQVIQELMESAAPGYGERAMTQYMGDLGIRIPSRVMLQGVQNIENYFRRAQFVHNLRREQKLARDSEGRIIDLGEDSADAALEGISETLQNTFTDLLGPKWGGRVQEALQNPDIVRRSLDETNKFMYNYSILGPTERRVVRQFIPFWGWYKFISLAAYRLPFEFPGRVNVIRQISNIAAEQEAEMGPLPEWIKGSIPLKFGDGKLTYLSTLGMNPFAQFFNPLGPKGPLEGALQLGQFNPVAQAGLSAFGFDPMTGDRVRISPESGVAEDFFGRLYNSEGDQVSPGQVAPLQRGIAGLLRSFPEYRIGERATYGPQYPESIPFVPGARRQMAPNEGGGGYSDILMQSAGVAPKSYNLATYQRLNRKAGRYAQRRIRSSQRKLKRKIERGSQ